MFSEKCKTCNPDDEAVCLMCIYRHPIITLLHDTVREVESGGCNEHLTNAVVLLDKVKTEVDKLVAENEDRRKYIDHLTDKSDWNERL